jgi:hypothetical protein
VLLMRAWIIYDEKMAGSGGLLAKWRFQWVCVVEKKGFAACEE